MDTNYYDQYKSDLVGANSAKAEFITSIRTGDIISFSTDVDIKLFNIMEKDTSDDDVTLTGDSIRYVYNGDKISNFKFIHNEVLRNAITGGTVHRDDEYNIEESNISNWNEIIITLKQQIENS